MGTPRHGHRPKDKPASPTYQSWQAMKARCLCPTAFGYASYGGRGIVICDKWLRFEGFFEDMGARPEGTSLERIDTDGNYEPDNCRWATASEQQRNRRDTKMLTFEGKTLPLVEWAQRFGLNKHTLKSRLFRYGWTIQEAITTPPLPPNQRRCHK